MAKKPFRINILVKEAFVATSALSVVVFLISLFSFKFEFVRPIKQELDDFDIYDLFYAGKGDHYQGIKDTDIYLIQAADTRQEIAAQIDAIESLQPAVVGIDLSFAAKKDKQTDSLLTAEIVNHPNLVPGYTLLPEEEGDKLVKENFLPKSFLCSNGGYINFTQPDTFSVIRSFAPFFHSDQKTYAAFTTRIVEKYSPEKLSKLKARNKSAEVINYIGNIDYYNNYSIDEFNELYATKQLEDIKGKIVLLGVFTKNDGSVRRMEDIRFSPLNSRVSGRSFPDVYGVVIHANIISMILDGTRYIHTSPLWVSYTISFILSFSFIWYILYLHKKHGHPKHIRLLLVQLPAIILIVYLFLKFFDWFQLKVALTPVFILLVLSMEMLDLYVALAMYLHKKIKYNTIFAHHKVTAV